MSRPGASWTITETGYAGKHVVVWHETFATKQSAIDAVKAYATALISAGSVPAIRHDLVETLTDEDVVRLSSGSRSVEWVVEPTRSQPRDVQI